MVKLLACSDFVEFLVDDEDAERVLKYKWFISKAGYVVANVSHKETPKGGTIYLHRLITGVEVKCQVDHIDHNKLNNTKENLRVCTASQNTCNSKLRKDSKSGLKGVGFDKRKNKYRSRIMINQRDIHIGYHDTAEEAVVARKAAEEQYHKEFRYKP